MRGEDYHMALPLSRENYHKLWTIPHLDTPKVFKSTTNTIINSLNKLVVVIVIPVDMWNDDPICLYSGLYEQAHVLVGMCIACSNMVAEMLIIVFIGSLAERGF